MSVTYSTNVGVAIQKGDFEYVRRCIAARWGIHYKNDWGEYPIYIAAGLGYGEIVKLLINAGVKVDVKNGKDMTTPLAIAISMGHDEIFDMLIEANADINLVSDNGQNTPLHYAAIYSSIRMAKILVDAGANTSARDKCDRTPFICACMNGDEELIDFFLGLGLSVNEDHFTSFTPFIALIHSGRTDLMQRFIDMGANIKFRIDQKVRILKTFQFCRKKEVIDFIFQIVDFEDVDKHEWHFLFNQPTDILSCFLKQGVNPNTTYLSGKRTLLDHAAQIGDLERVRLLVECGACVENEMELHPCVTPLGHAAESGHVDCVCYLLDQGSSMYSLDVNNEFPFEQAVRSGNLPTIHAFVVRGADVNWKTYKNKPLFHYACSSNNIQLMEYFLKHGADVHSVDSKGNTALHIICARGYRDVKKMKLLLAFGAVVNVENASGVTPLQISIGNWSSEYVEWLLLMGAVPPIRQVPVELELNIPQTPFDQDPQLDDDVWPDTPLDDDDGYENEDFAYNSGSDNVEITTESLTEKQKIRHLLDAYPLPLHLMARARHELVGYKIAIMNIPNPSCLVECTNPLLLD